MCAQNVLFLQNNMVLKDILKLSSLSIRPCWHAQLGEVEQQGPSWVTLMLDNNSSNGQTLV